jgi:hypothetical protein
MNFLRKIPSSRCDNSGVRSLVTLDVVGDIFGV